MCKRVRISILPFRMELLPKGLVSHNDNGEATAGIDPDYDSHPIPDVVK
jgi:hypothetical protein